MQSETDKLINTPKISAIINTRNEEKNLRYCLETVRWCDEIIVVDMESNDRTVEIAREFTDKIFNHPKVLAFDIAKKFAYEQTTGDWILLIDADEMISYQLSKTLLEIAKKSECDIVEIPFKHYIMGECIHHSGWGYTPLPRFFRRGKIIFTETIHGYMHKTSDARIVGLESVEENCIVHFNYIDSFHFVEKLNRYTNVEAKLLFDRGISFSYRVLIKASIREFYSRFLISKGYKDGVRGFSLSLMMAFYRTLSYIKLWEKHQFNDISISERYELIKQDILAGWKQ